MRTEGDAPSPGVSRIKLAALAAGLGALVLALCGATFFVAAYLHPQWNNLTSFKVTAILTTPAIILADFALKKTKGPAEGALVRGASYTALILAIAFLVGAAVWFVLMAAVSCYSDSPLRFA